LELSEGPGREAVPLGRRFEIEDRFLERLAAAQALDVPPRGPDRKNRDEVEGEEGAYLLEEILFLGVAARAEKLPALLGGRDPARPPDDDRHDDSLLRARGTVIPR